MPDLGLDGESGGVGEVDGLAGDGDVRGEGQFGAVEHDRGEAVADGLDDLLDALAVVEMQDDGHLGVGGEIADERRHVTGLVIAEQPLEDLNDHRLVLAFGGQQRCLGGLAVDHVKGADGMPFGTGLGQNLVEGDQGHGKSISECRMKK